MSNISNISNMKKLKAMLSYTRAHGSEGEALFVEEYIMPYEPTLFKGGNGEVLAYVVDVMHSENGVAVVPPILFSSHVDTVHTLTDPVFQEVMYDKGMGIFFKDDKRPLGADDGAGVWLMLEMIDAQVPGSYIFHRGEERGGIGSSGMARDHKDWLARFKWAIAFDRRGSGDVITEMACGTVCSKTFANALAAKINVHPDVNKLTQLEYAPNDTGLFTDTANYRGIIPECTNVSCGYDMEHTGNETLDWWHLSVLRDAVIEAFMGAFQEGTGDLPVERDPAIQESIYDTEYWQYVTHKDFKTKGYHRQAADEPMCAADITTMSYGEVVKWIRMSDPEEVAELVYQMAEDLMFRDDVVQFNQEEM